MMTILLVIHVFITLALIGTVLLQRSEGGALGIGGGGGGAGGGFMSGRAAGNMLTRATTLLAAGFMATSILLAILGGNTAPSGSIFDESAPVEAPVSAPAEPAAPAVPSAPIANE